MGCKLRGLARGATAAQADGERQTQATRGL